MNIYICNMVKIHTKSIQDWHNTYKEKSLHGRYITLDAIQSLLLELNATEIGRSVLDKPIYKYQIGTGNTKVLIWSQMHGNESTGTKALIDLITFLTIKPHEFHQLISQLLNNTTLIFVPMLNPDGAEAYTRVNANSIDLNRDAVRCSQPESQLLRAVLEETNPAYCFNLHDQRTIFTVGNTKETATLSFLAPSINEERSLTDGRKKTMEVIVSINELMQTIISGKIGRYTDEFYPNATGDNFQKMGHHTILIEAGHFKGDYKRSKVRFYNFAALLQGLNYISSNHKNTNYEDYFNIPNNTENYLDIIYKNIYLEAKNKKVDVGILYKEQLKDNTVIFIPTIEEIGDLSDYNADIIEDKNGLSFNDISEIKDFFKKIV